MANYTVLNKLPDLSFLTPVGECIRLCDDCLEKKYTNSPPSVAPRALMECECCEEIRICYAYEKKRLTPAPKKKRVKHVSIAEKFNIVRFPSPKRGNISSSDDE